MAKEQPDPSFNAENPRRRAPRSHSPFNRAAQPYLHRNQTVEVPEGYFAVGRITSVHGLKGELKVELHTDFPERFTPGMPLFVTEDLVEYTVRQARPHKNQLLLQLEGVNTREAAEALRNAWLFVDEADTIALADDTYWVHDIVGLTVQTEEGQTLGTVTEVLFTGANEVYVIETESTVNQGKPLLLPAIGEVIRQIDLEAALITVHLIPGLLEE